MTLAALDNPHALWLLLLLPVYWWITRRRVTTVAVRYPSVRNVKRLPRSLRHRFRALLPVMRSVALVLLVIVLARPVQPQESEILPSKGIGIAMVVDRSGSMAMTENRLLYEDQLQLRIDVARKVLKLFVEGDGDELSGRPNDLIGLFTFATYPQTDHPFTLDHTSLLNVVDTISAEKPFLDAVGRPTDDISQAAPRTDEQGRVLRDMFGRTAPRTNPMQFTDLTKAIEYTATKLLALEADLKRASGGLRKYTLESKIMVLLTDGEPTVADGRRGPDYPDDETIKMLADAGVRVYFIQILSRELYRERPDGTVELVAPQGGGIFGGANRMRHQQQMDAVNEAIEQARRLARRTEGEHFLATSGEQLRDIYKRIDELERSDIGGRTVFSQEERYRPYLFAALALLGLEQLLTLTWLRRSP